MKIMAKEEKDKDTISQKEKINIILLKNIKENISIFINKNMNNNLTIPFFVKNSLETAFIDLAIYLEEMNNESDVDEYMSRINEKEL